LTRLEGEPIFFVIATAAASLACQSVALCLRASVDQTNGT
jgi:hypothetical protein